MNRSFYRDILNSEMELATGCTEPAAIALTAAYAAKYLEQEVSDIAVHASVNIIKNAMAAGLPGTTYTGIDYAAAIGAVGGHVEDKLTVIDGASDADRQRAIELVQNGHVSVYKKETEEKLYIEVEVFSENGHKAKAIIASSHTNVIHAERDGKIIFDYPIGTRREGFDASVIDREMSIQSIYEYANTADEKADGLEIIRRAIEVNTAIAKEGAKKAFNLQVGRSIASMHEKGLLNSDMVSMAMQRTACGIDARMGGANVPVMTNSGSGNQGITATVPVLTAAEYLGADEEKTFHAVTLSHLMCIYIHSHFGLLSALCGATVAGTASACGIAYLMGGGPGELENTINNMMGTVTGMLCDGAKPDCALKVAVCVNAAFICAQMAINGISVKPNEGIVEKQAEKTIQNFVRLGNDGSPTMDNIILDIMLSKDAK